MPESEGDQGGPAAQLRAGARQDRPAYVLEDFPVAPGLHHLAIEFATAPTPEAPASHPPSTVEERVALAPREILLVTIDPHTDRSTVLRR